MVARIFSGLLVAGALANPVFISVVSAEPLEGEAARRFVAGKLFAFTCFDGSRGAGRIFADGSVAGSIQISGKGKLLYARLPTNTLQVRSDGSICASLKGIPFEPCFNVERSNSRAFRGSVSGMSFAYCDFHRQGHGRVAMTRSISARASSRPRSLHAPNVVRQADAAASVAQVEETAFNPNELRKSAE